jgi:hypothetical protein
MPASFADVGFDSVLMFPALRLPKYSDLLEGKPVPPDVPVERAALFAAGHDPILDAGLAEARRLAKLRKGPPSMTGYLLDRSTSLSGSRRHPGDPEPARTSAR